MSDGRNAVLDATPTTPGPGSAEDARSNEAYVLGVTGLILGVVSLAACSLPVLNVFTGIGGAVAILLGTLALLEKRQAEWMPIAGIIAGMIGFLATVMAIVVWTVTLTTSARAVIAELSASAPSQSQADNGSSGTQLIAPSSPGPLRFGTTVTYADGTTISVGPATAYTPTDPADTTQKVDLEFSVTMTDSTKGKDLYVAVMSSAAAGKTRADKLYENGLDPTGSAMLAPGQSVTYHLAFSFASTHDVSVDVAPGYDYRSVRFAG